MRPRAGFARGARHRGRGRPHPHSRSSSCCRSSSDDAGLGELAQAVSTPGRPSTATTSRSSSWRAGSGPRPGPAARVVRYLRRGRRHRRQDRRDRLVRRRDDDGRAAPSACSRRRSPGSGRRGTRSSSPRTGAVGVPPALSGVVTGVVGLDTQPLSGPRAPPPAGSVATPMRRPSRPQRSPDRDRRAGAPPAGCRRARRRSGHRRVHPEPVPDRLWLRPAPRRGVGGQGERVALIEIDGFKTLRHQHVRAVLRPARAAAERVRRSASKHPLAPGGESTLDLEVLDAAAPDLKAIDVYETQPERRRHARGDDRAAAEPRPATRR